MGDNQNTHAKVLWLEKRFNELLAKFVPYAANGLAALKKNFDDILPMVGYQAERGFVQSAVLIRILVDRGITTIDEVEHLQAEFNAVRAFFGFFWKMQDYAQRKTVERYTTAEESAEEGKPITDEKEGKHGGHPEGARIFGGADTD